MRLTIEQKNELLNKMGNELISACGGEPEDALGIASTMLFHIMEITGCTHLEGDHYSVVIKEGH